MLSFALDPVPHDAARRLIADKPAVIRDVVDAMPDEMKARAYFIKGIEDFDVLQNTRDLIARIPAGADWGKIKKEIAAQISPWFTPAGAANRADLLLAHHAFSAYASCQARIMDAQMDTFPWRQYLSTKDGKVRATHRALHGIILRADSPFWRDHTPPWEFRCRCQVVELLDDEAAEELAKDQSRKPEDRRVLEGPALARLEAGTITRGPEQSHVLGTPLQSVRATTLPYEEIATRWDARTRKNFEDKAAATPMENGGSLLSHLTGHTAVASPRTRREPRPASFAAALDASGLATAATWSRTALANLRASMRVAAPAQAADLLAGISGARQVGVLTEKEILRSVQDMLDILPPEIAGTLPKLQITLTQYLTDAKGHRIDDIGDYKPPGKHTGGARIRLAVDALKGLKGEERRREMRRTLSHELMHWLHSSATHPDAAAYRARIRSHYLSRTAGDIEEPDGKGGCFRRDRWWDRYAGREYAEENGKPNGMEVPSRHFELWEAPETAMLFADMQHPDSAAFRETFALVHSIFNSP
jgi:SPP1 gp7 family putative phage head morphogenesis protein